jgi:glutamate 5-kinase
MGLVQMWESCFAELGLHTAQVLLTHEDLGDRRRYLNARTTLKSLVALGVVPIINENDTVVVDEIRFGDNDTLGALVTNLIEADALVILTDQKGLYSPTRASPRTPSSSTRHARAIPRSRPWRAARARPRQRRHAHQGARREARGAQRRAHRDRVGRGSRRPCAPLRGESDRHAARRDTAPVAARKQWLADHLKPRGRITLDAGAVKALVATARACSPSAPPRSRAPSSAARW